MTERRNAETLALLKDKYPVKPLKDRTEPSEIPRWAKLACTRMIALGETLEEAAGHFGKKRSTLSKWANTPAMLAWSKQLEDWADDPVKVAQSMIKGSVLEAALDQLWAIEAAKSQGDYREVRIATRDILATHEILKPSQHTKAGAAPVVIQLQLGGDVEVPVVKTAYDTIIPEAEYNLLPEDPDTGAGE